VLRGGSWNNKDNNARGAYRNNNNPDNWNNNIGFRVVVSSSSRSMASRQCGAPSARRRCLLSETSAACSRLSMFSGKNEISPFPE
jgi:hypothetical protein